MERIFSKLYLNFQKQIREKLDEKFRQIRASLTAARESSVRFYGFIKSEAYLKFRSVRMSVRLYWVLRSPAGLGIGNNSATPPPPTPLIFNLFQGGIQFFIGYVLWESTDICIKKPRTMRVQYLGKFLRLVFQWIYNNKTSI